MYFLLLSTICVTTAQLSVQGVTEEGFFLEFEESQIRGETISWVVHKPHETLSLKELNNGVTDLGIGCSGQVTLKQLRSNSEIEVLCELQYGKAYTVEALVTKPGQEHQILTTDFDFSNRRRLLDTPSKSPVTSAPTAAPSISAKPTRAPITSAPTTPNGGVANPSAFPTSFPSTIPSVASTSLGSTTTTSVPIQIMSTSLKPEDNEGSNFVGFDLSSGGGVSLFIFAIMLLVGALLLILGGPYLYRRYYETFGSSVKTVEAGPKLAAKLSSVIVATPSQKAKLGSSFRSESKIEIAPIKSEDKIRLADPIE